MKDRQRDGSLDEKIIDMVDKLLDDTDNDMPKVTPILMINNIPIASKRPSFNEIHSQMGKSGLGANRLGLGVPQMDFSPREGINQGQSKRNSDGLNFSIYNQLQSKNVQYGSPNSSISIDSIGMNMHHNSMQSRNSESMQGGKVNYQIKIPQLNTRSLNYPAAGQFQPQPSPTLTSSSLRTAENYLSTSSCNSTNSGDIAIKTRPKRHVEEGITVMHEIDEQLESKVKLFEKVDEESLPHFKGSFLKIIKSQNGSRILQKALNKTNSEIFSIIFSEIKTALPDLLVDSYANYFCQRFYDHLEYWEKIEFLLNIKYSIVMISNSQIGTYPLQAIIDQMKTKEERKIIIEAVREHVLEMCQHAQGTHVIEKMILCFEEDSIKYIYDIILENFMFLACHSNGLCVTKKVIACSHNFEYIATVQKILLENANVLVQNSHGNYSIQVALESWDYEYVYPLINLFHNQFFTLSTQKFSSNVVEKCLERGGEAVLAKFLDEICHKTKILELMKNPFGNYVVQKALKLATGFHKGKLTGIIKKHLEKLRDKKLINKWKDILNNISGNTLTLNHLNFNKLINVKINTPMDSPNNSFHSHSPIFSHSPHSHNSHHSNHTQHSPHSQHSPRSNRSTQSQNSFISYNSNNSFNHPSSPNMIMKNIMYNNNIHPISVNNLFVPSGQDSRSGMNSPQLNIMPISPRSPQQQFLWKK